MSKIIAVDFDGTLCENKWPEIGYPNYHIIKHIRKQQASGCKIILWTCRAGELLEKALEWCEDHNLYFDAVNENVPEILEKFEVNSRKIYADEYIDDKANTTFVLPFDSDFQAYQKAAITAARDLGYRESVITRLEYARTKDELSILMNRERNTKK